MCITRCLAACLVAGRTFVLGNDSDFYLFKDCRYVNFSDVVFVRPQGADPAEQTVQVAVNVYTRAALSKLLAVSEKFLVDFAIYLGNDYTGGQVSGMVVCSAFICRLSLWISLA